MTGAFAKPASPRSLLEELLSRPDEHRCEIVDGKLVEKQAVSGKHGGAQVATSHLLFPFHRRNAPPGQPGGWLFATEALVELEPTQLRRPDVAGWQRNRLEELPTEVPIRVVPDWICEILSPSNASDDTIVKMRLYHQSQVGHYWLLDPMACTLTVYRWTPDGYLHVLGATRTERVRAEPFDAIELPVGVFFGDEETAGQ